MADPRAVRAHYGRAGLGEAILAVLAAAGKDTRRLTHADLAPVDEFHTRGPAATRDMARLLALGGGEAVLDVGSGLGGPARWLARETGARVTGIDLTPEFVAAAILLTERCGLADKVTFQTGDALALPFAAASFDVVWSQNSVMNIADRPQLYAEIRRVLKPGGRYAFSDVVAGPGGAPHFPVPWARDPAASHLLAPDETRGALEAAGFRILAFEDQTADALRHTQARAKEAAGPPRELGIHLVLGELWPAIARNNLRNLEERRTGLVQGIAATPA